MNTPIEDPGLYHPPGSRRQTANVYGLDPNTQRPMAAPMQNDQGLWQQIKEAIRRVLNYFVNLIRAIFGLPPVAPGPAEGAASPIDNGRMAATNDTGRDLGQKRNNYVPCEAQDAAKFEDAANAPNMQATSGAANDPMGGGDASWLTPVTPIANRPGAATGGMSREAFPTGGALGFAPAPQGAIAFASAESVNGMVNDDPQRLFAAMAESLAQCVQTCQQGNPFTASADPGAYLQAMSDRLQGAIAGLRTLQALHLDSSMLRADASFDSGSGKEVEIAERWIADGGAITPERAQALREIASAQMLGVMSQIARLGLQEQSLQAQGLDDPALSGEIQQMLVYSTQLLAQASVFARAAGENPANLVRSMQAQLDQRIQQDIARDHSRRQQGDLMGEQEQGGDSQNWDSEYRPA